MIEAVTDRFERRLVEETSKLRIEMTQGFAAVRHEMSGLGHELAGLRQAMTQELAALRHSTTQDLAALRQELGAQRQATTEDMSGIRQAMTLDRFELLKWAFLFWVGQFFATASLAVILVRFLKAGG